ncbi:MAG: hypothetical protein P8L83_04980 [Flavobacteriaceae bacterium]|nr:hypothetical protein [Flavobacteriaceae bacterium]
MKYPKLLKIVFISSLLVLITSCQSEYDRTVNREMSSGKNYTDLIFGLKLGQTQKDFYTHCWELNKKKLINQGPSNQFVRHVLDSVSPIYNPNYNMELLFYGIFDDKKIMTGMKMRISYLGWDPVAKNLQKDSLLDEGMKMIESIFSGNSFINLNKDINGLPIMVKVDGNRQVTAYVYDNRFVELIIEDLNRKIK